MDGVLLNTGTGRGKASRGAGLGAFLCQRAHLTVALMEDGDVPKSPDGIRRSARRQLVKGGQASCIMEPRQTRRNLTAALIWGWGSISVSVLNCF